MLGFRSHNVCEDSKAGKRRNKGAKRLSFTTRCVFVLCDEHLIFRKKEFELQLSRGWNLSFDF